MSYIVYSFVRRRPEYPWEAVERGIRNAGYVQGKGGVSFAKNNALITWNCYGGNKRAAQQMRQAGGVHCVMENGYLRRSDGYYIVSRDGHNGLASHLVRNTGPERFEKLNLRIEPWRRSGSVVLVCGQRGGSYNELAMSNEWPQDVLCRLRKFTDREIWYRPHPGRTRLPAVLPENCKVVSNEEPLREQLKHAHALVVWTSNAAHEALLMGVPVIYEGPSLAAAELSVPGVENVEAPVYADRRQYFWDLAWQQWNAEEINKGIAFKHVIGEEF